MSASAAPGAASADDRRARRLPALAAILAIFTAIFASNVPTPLYGVWQAQWGFSDGALTAMFSVYVVGVVAALPTIGALSDLAGRRQVLVPGLLCMAAAALVFASAGDIYWLGVGRLLTGLGTGIVTGSATAALVELDPDNNWARSAAISAMTLTAGATAGPLVSSAALRFDLWPTAGPFAVVGTVAAATIVLMVTVRWPAHLGQRRPGFRLRHWRPTRLSVPREIFGSFALAGAAMCLAWSTGSLYAALGPSLAVELAGIDDRALAGLYAAAFQLVAGVGQFLARRHHPEQLLFTGPLILGAGMSIGVVGILLTSPLGFALGTVTTAFGAGVTAMGAVATISREAPIDRRGEVVSSFYVLAYLTMASVVLGVGTASDGFGLEPTMIALGGLTLAAAGILVRAGVRSGRAGWSAPAAEASRSRA
ncbi:MFS transporter [Aquisalimonas lutea]|uniref:MFS transporter n=1 Tax=Aquisalimonas lutea TaxID=1327750 RepID=UPI0025B49A3A|nr:MFS transporter [Aquisalimonas lutea]MDN3517311.1 MFS transporter [Aquisalimonas lutea]